MNQDQKAVWDRYATAWKAPTLAEKQAILGTCVARSCVYTDPLAVARGWDELTAHMSQFQEQLPGAYFITEYFLAHHGKSIARWKMMKDDVQIGEGMSYGEYDADNRLVAMTGFFEGAAG